MTLLKHVNAAWKNVCQASNIMSKIEADFLEVLEHEGLKGVGMEPGQYVFTAHPEGVAQWTASHVTGDVNTGQLAVFVVFVRGPYQGDAVHSELTRFYLSEGAAKAGTDIFAMPKLEKY